MSGKASGRAALALTAASFGAAALNYLFQVHAVNVLDERAFGALSAWLARVTLAGIVATVVQFVSLDHRLGEGAWRRAATAGGGGAAVLLVLHVVVGTQLPVAALSVSAIAGGILLYAMVGQLQARLQLGVMAAAVGAAAVVRFGLPFAWARGAREGAFYLGHAGAAWAGMVAVGVAAWWGAKAKANADADAKAKADANANAGAGVRWRRPVLLAFAASLFPLLDILLVSATHDAATTGAFSRVALGARVVFFVGAAALQILLPYELHASRSGEPLPSFSRRLRRWLTSAMIAFAVVLAGLLDRFVLHPAGEERTWLYASSLSFALLVGILGHLNRFAAHGKLGVATALTLGVVVTSCAAAGLATLDAYAPVTRYVLGALFGDAIVLVLAVTARTFVDAGGAEEGAKRP